MGGCFGSDPEDQYKENELLNYLEDPICGRCCDEDCPQCEHCYEFKCDCVCEDE